MARSLILSTRKRKRSSLSPAARIRLRRQSSNANITILTAVRSARPKVGQPIMAAAAFQAAFLPVREDPFPRSSEEPPRLDRRGSPSACSYSSLIDPGANLNPGERNLHLADKAREIPVRNGGRDASPPPLCPLRGVFFSSIPSNNIPPSAPTRPNS